MYVPKVENTISSIVFYLLMLFVLVAFFEVLGLELITAPLNALLNTIFAYLPSLLAAGVLIVVAWIVATILRGLVKKVLDGAGVDKRLGNDVDPDKMSVSKAVSDAVYWLVWLIFLLPILGALGLAKSGGIRCPPCLRKCWRSCPNCLQRPYPGRWLVCGQDSATHRHRIPDGHWHG